MVLLGVHAAYDFTTGEDFPISTEPSLTTPAAHLLGSRYSFFSFFSLIFISSSLMFQFGSIIITRTRHDHVESIYPKILVESQINIFIHSNERPVAVVLDARSNAIQYCAGQVPADQPFPQLLSGDKIATIRARSITQLKVSLTPLGPFSDCTIPSGFHQDMKALLDADLSITTSSSD